MIWRDDREELAFVGDVQRVEAESSQAPRTSSRTGIAPLRSDAETGVARQFIERCSDAAACGVAHPAEAGPTACARASTSGRRSGCRRNVGFEIEFAAGQQDRDAMIADRARRITLSPGRTRAGREAQRGIERPMPAVVMYSVGLAVLDDFGVAAGDGDAGRAAAAAMARDSRFEISVGRPASRIRSTTSACGRAPDTARSLTVPLTARSPMEPPGKRSGRTTKLSAVIAMRGAADRERGRRRREGGGQRSNSSGAMSSSTRRRLALPPAPCAISICGRESGAFADGGSCAS